MSELVTAERASFLLAARAGKANAHDLVGRAARSGSFRDGLVEAGLTEEEADWILDPAGYLGAAGAFVDRALALHEGSA